METLGTRGVLYQDISFREYLGALLVPLILDEFEARHAVLATVCEAMLKLWG